MNLPCHAYFEITRQCNQSCPFCSCVWLENDAPQRPELPMDEWKEAAKELIANGVRYIAVTGGEPTLKNGARELFRHISDMLNDYHPHSHELALFSNGKNVSSEWLELVADCKAELYTSLPGLNSFTTQTGERADDFRRCLNVIHEASQRGIRTSVGVTITRQNLFELYEICSYCVLSGAAAVILNVFKPSGRGAHHSELLLSEDDIRSAAKTADEVAATCGNAVSFGGEFPPFIRPDAFPHIQVENRCAAAKGTFTVAPDGWLHICEHDREGLCYWRDWKTLGNCKRWKIFADYPLEVCPLFE